MRKGKNRFTCESEVKNCYEWLGEHDCDNGNDAQDLCLHDTDEHSLTEGERMYMILAVTKWEIEHNCLTPELKSELDIYYDDFFAGKMDIYVDEDERNYVGSLLTECYNKVFGQN